MATNGIRLITPTSVAVTGAGSSASINAGGSVTFATAATLSLNGVFSSLYDNYIIDLRNRKTTTSTNIAFRLRASGIDEASASNYYTIQNLSADSTTVSGSRSTGNTGQIGSTDVNGNGQQVYIYGPALSQPTAWRNVDVAAFAGAYLLDRANTHSLSVAYDGFTLSLGSGAFGGLIKVYGLVQ
jgi:hypothetical protein